MERSPSTVLLKTLTQRDASALAMADLIYLDNHATTPCDPLVVEAMLPYFSEVFANPSSTLHEAGREAAASVADAREKVAQLIGAQAGEIAFTSGATESNNIAIVGLANGAGKGRRRIVTTAIEHKAVLASVEQLKSQGFEVIVLPVAKDGTVDVHAAEESIHEDTLLVSLQVANNEIGTIQPVAEVGRIARERGALLHCDAAQAAGRIPVDVEAWNVDLLSISAHKLYGPKGVGALYVRGGPYALPISPLSVGGGQEKGLRAGTHNVPGIVGLGEACRLCEQRLPKETTRLAALRDRLEETVLAAVPDARRNGALDNRLPGNSSLTFPGIDAEALVINASELAISTGSACTSGAPEPSHVLLAIGLDRDAASSTIRIGVGRFNTEEEMEMAAGAIVGAVERLARMRT
jgi:cysteine desulfurase